MKPQLATLALGSDLAGLAGRRAVIARPIAVLLASLLVACGPTPAASPGLTPAGASGSPGASGPSGTRSPVPADAAVAVVASGLSTPVGLAAYPGRADILVVWEQTGTVRVLRGEALLEAPFLDLRDRLVALQADYDERGLLGLAFHPAFDTNGRLFVYYGAPTRPGASGDHTNRLSEFRVDPADPLHVDPATERVLLEFEQPQFNHSGGGLGFGPDGLLYLGTGDGGGQGDASVGHSQQGNAQDRSKLNGKILRIDVDDGPVTRPEIYAYGFRNPWRLAWEPDGLRRLLVSDVGYGRYEEIDVVDRGANYGWRIREGRHCLDVDHPLETVTDCPTAGAGDEPLVDPVVEYSHAEIGIAVVGGYVYRGVSLPAFAGRYVFADFTRDWKGPVPTPRANLLIADPQPEGVAEWPWRPLRLQGGLIPRFVTGMGEDASGELYVLSRDELGPTGDGGVVLRIVPPGP